MLLCLLYRNVFSSLAVWTGLRVEAIFRRVSSAPTVLPNLSIDYALLRLRLICSLGIYVRREPWLQGIRECRELSHHLWVVLHRCRVAQSSCCSLTWRAEHLVVLYSKWLTVYLWNILQIPLDKLPYIFLVFLERVAVNVDMLQSF